MKVKKQKVGRPKKKDKKVAYAFTVLESIKDAALKMRDKEDYDKEFRDRLATEIKSKIRNEAQKN